MRKQLILIKVGVRVIGSVFREEVIHINSSFRVGQEAGQGSSLGSKKYRYRYTQSYSQSCLDACL